MRKRGRAGAAPTAPARFNSLQAKRTVVRRLRRRTVPIRPKPPIIIAQLAGSGAGAGTFAVATDTVEIRRSSQVLPPLNIAEVASSFETVWDSGVSKLRLPKKSSS